MVIKTQNAAIKERKEHQPVRTEDNVGNRTYHYPNHQMVKSWMFYDVNTQEGYLRSFNEANLADAMAHVAADNDISANELQHVFPMVLRMLKSKSNWAK